MHGATTEEESGPAEEVWLRLTKGRMKPFRMTSPACRNCGSESGTLRTPQQDGPTYRQQ